MASVTRIRFLVSLCFLFGFLLILKPTPLALAAVDCEARPNHPQCGGGEPPLQFNHVVVDSDPLGSKVVGPVVGYATHGTVTRRLAAHPANIVEAGIRPVNIVTPRLAPPKDSSADVI